MRRIVIGLAGPIASGKGIVSRFLQDQGFAYFSLSGQIRKECRERGLDLKTETLRKIGNEVRRELGVEEWARRVARLINQSKAGLVVVDGLRNPGEIKLLKEEYNIYVVGVDASFEVRFQRHLEKRKRDDPLEELRRFQRINARDLGANQEHYDQQVAACLKLADEIIKNESSSEDLETKVKTLIKRLKTKEKQ